MMNAECFAFMVSMGWLGMVDAPGNTVINWLGDRVAGKVPLQSFTLRS